MVRNSPLIRTLELGKVYSSGKIRVEALRRVSLEISSGTFTGITGSSGSGKSTLMNLLAGLDRPTDGRILVEGIDITRMSREELALYRRFQVGMVFQSFNLVPAMTARENTALPLLFAGVPRRERMKRAEETLDRVGLSGRLHHRPGELSGGEQQRTAIARALVNRPRILLADEPTGNLDSRTSEEIVRLMARLNREEGLTVLMISHETALLREAAEKIYGLRDGCLETDGETGA